MCVHTSAHIHVLMCIRGEVKEDVGCLDLSLLLWVDHRLPYSHGTGSLSEPGALEMDNFSLTGSQQFCATRHSQGFMVCMSHLTLCFEWVLGIWTRGPMLRKSDLPADPNSLFCHLHASPLCASFPSHPFHLPFQICFVTLLACISCLLLDLYKNNKGWLSSRKATSKWLDH